ncbi:uncharacterized protein LOC124252811 [Haliotis rubra]|uniref:uncharacterized protein LOC124252811 n=1 Tax=Haliotis rubra TaxID=36100 RepID=UPI001EE5FCE6|nr:uncharacterized protein LOC124252811 [Haliotis rubra]
MSLLHSMKRFPISYLTDTCTSTSQTVDTPIGPQVVGSTLGHQAPLIRPIVVPKMEDRCGDVTFPKDDNLPELDSIATLKHQWKDLELSVDESQNLEKNTRSQSKSDLWYKARKGLITASNFGLLMTRKKQINDTFIRNTFDKE